MTVPIPIIDYPKIHCPFKRHRNEAGHYVVIPEMEEGFEWIWEDGVRAVDKLHGTNICVHIRDRCIEAIDNRSNRRFQCQRISTVFDVARPLIGALKAADRGWLKEDGDYYGELIGPTYNGNLHGAPDHLFVPFNVLLEKYHWHSWIRNDYPKTFDSLSEWFKTIPSLFSKQVFKKDVLAEGLVFYHPSGNRRAKLRRDMFDWFQGDRHKEAS